MALRTIYTTLLFWSVFTLYAQTNFSYNIQLEPVTITGLPGLHSYAHAQYDNKWVLIGGRLDGIHARQPFNAFPESDNNTDIYVVTPETAEVWSASVETLSVGLSEQLQATNLQFFQDGEQLVVIGGYAYSASEGDHLTFPYLTVVDIPNLIDHIISEESIAEDFLQMTDDNFAVTGGYLGKIDDTYYLVGGHRFDGRYNPIDHPTFTQTYVDGLKKFTLSVEDGVLTYDNFVFVSDPIHLHRRDYNLMPQIYPTGDFGYTAFSGVFQVTQDLPFLYPVDITASGHEAITAFNQYLSQYHSAHVALFDESQNAMHNLFFGGMSQYFYGAGNMIQDDNVPFVKTISRVSRDAEGNLEEVRLPHEMPEFLGASAELLINPNLPQIAPDIVDLSAIESDSFSLGYIVGGLHSPIQHPFATNATGLTSAMSTLYKVVMVKNETTSTADILPGYHAFKMTAFPNPTRQSVFQIRTQVPESGTLELSVMDTTGRLVQKISKEISGVGEYPVTIELPAAKAGLYHVSGMLNGKYAATTSILLE